jgi:hypothetical protein
MKSKISMLLAAFLFFGLAACGSTKTDRNAGRSCPETGFLKHTDEMTYDNKEYKLEAKIINLTGGCSFDPAEVSMNVNLDFAGQWTARGMEAPKRIKLPYFATVLDDQEDILHKTRYETVLKMDDTLGLSSETVSLRIPVAEGANAADYRVIFGFSVTPNQFYDNQMQYQKDIKP